MRRFPRITIDPAVMGGRPCIRGMRMTVAAVLRLIAEGNTPADILDGYPYLEKEDIDEALAYAAWLAESPGEALTTS